MNAERYDNQSYEMITMMQNCKIDYGNQPNSRTDLKRNFSSTRGKENALTNVSHFNFNDQINDPTLANAYGYGDDNWSQYTGNNNVKKNDINIINLNGNLKKFIKSRIHSKRLKLQKPYFQMKVKL